ncbi:MAG: NAD(P)/FAD-dependent oxidoreductase [Deltaproteobacteria bacterium]|nr:NAD(P)/FAD-dependent oxidoreductase [Deltaproteobacteria bacterium]
MTGGPCATPSSPANPETKPGRVIVVGAGAGGMMAAGRAAERGAEVLLLEKTDGPGKKILVSGKSRCNLTNARELQDFFSMYGPNGRFLHGAFHRFFREDLIAFLKRYGVETKVERGGRIFPVSDDAADVVKAFRRYLKAYGVKIRNGVPVTGIAVRGGCVEGVRTGKGFLPARAVILATGGATWPATGSTGDGFRIAAVLGHTVTKLRPALVPLVVTETGRAKSMQGVSLKNVRLTAFRGPAEGIDPALTPAKDIGRGLEQRRRKGPVIESRMGEMLFTHFGIGGPITLLMSLAVVDALAEGPVGVMIDLKPALAREALRARLQRDFDHFGKRGFRSLLAGLLPHKMIEPFIEMSGIPADRPGHQITAGEREKLLDLLKALRFNIKGPLPMSAAIVTAGGVALQEIDPRTMASRLVDGLFFCGEVMDIDADTGGYNLQAAFSTGFVAGEAAAAFVQGFAKGS